MEDVNNTQTPLGKKENPHPITPPVKDRIKGHYYIYKNELRYWDGSKLINKEKEKARCKKYKKNNKEKIKEYNQEYRENNKEKEKARQKEYRENNKEKINKIAKEYRENNKEKEKARQKEYYENNKEKIMETQKEYRENNKEKINKIAKEYYENNKEKERAKNKEYYENNKEKEKARQKEYYENNKEKMKEYRENNKEKIKETQKEYYENNKEKRNENLRKRRKNDPIFRLTTNTRSRVWTALKAQNAPKNQRTVEYVNCSVAHLHNHIESQFKDSGMNWDNMGKDDGEGGRGWEVDHRRPCASFDLKDEEQKYICFHWTNLQPMWGQENNKKSNDYDPKTFRYKWIDRETGWVGIPKYLMNNN